MEENVGSIDRIARLVIGAVVLLAGVAVLGGVVGGSVILGVVLAVVGIVLIGTGITQMCALYSVLGVDTCEV